MEPKERKRGKRRELSPAERIEIIKDFHDKKMAIADIARKYGICYNSAKDVTRKYKYNFWLEKTPEKPFDDLRIPEPVTKKRKEHSENRRNEMLRMDALEITELTFQAIREILNDGKQRKLLTAPQLSGFLNVVAPYILEKPNTREKPKADHSKMKDIFKLTHAKESNN